MFSCQQVLINNNTSVLNVLKFICSEANKLTNCGIYYGRQVWFKVHKYLSKFDLINEYKSNPHYQVLHSQAAQQTLISVRESFNSFYKLDKKFKDGNLEHKPKPPSYRKKGSFALVSYPEQALKLVDNSIQVPLGLTTDRWVGLKNFLIRMPSNLKFEDIKELRILPRNHCFYAEFVYEVKSIKANVDFSKVLGIDPGLSNWLTCVSNVGTSIIVDGLHLKSLNQFYNKQISTIKDKKPQGFWSNKLATITEKRNRQMRDAVNKAACKVLAHCLAHQIGTIVFGWNSGHKQSSNLDKQNNQNFVSIPTAKLKDRIAGLCE